MKNSKMAKTKLSKTRRIKGNRDKVVEATLSPLRPWRYDSLSAKTSRVATNARWKMVNTAKLIDQLPKTPQMWPAMPMNYALPFKAAREAKKQWLATRNAEKAEAKRIDDQRAALRADFHGARDKLGQARRDAAMIAGLASKGIPDDLINEIARYLV